MVEMMMVVVLGTEYVDWTGIEYLDWTGIEYVDWTNIGGTVLVQSRDLGTDS
jgi:hypothetical protein